ncbi:MAG TPA: hypothetical protein VFD04_07150, partial [Actinomycetes bacterium]|nr:hypothetical protein [Actinomycetes bacterium]
AGAADAAALPPSLQEVLLARVTRLDRRTQRVLGVAAAAGPGVTQPVLTGVSGMEEAELLDSLHEAVDHQVLLPEPDGDGYVFRHSLVAEAVYGELLPGERIRLHTTLAGLLQSGVDGGGTPAARAARLAHHWSAAGDQPRALTASLQAAAAAERVYAFAEAALQLERVLALWERVPDAAARVGTDRVALLSRCAQAADAAGDTARAAQLVRQALALVDGTQQPRRAGLLHEQLARCLRALGDPDALDEQQQAVRLVPPETSVERARVLGSLAVYLEVVDRFADAKEAAEEAIAIVKQVGAGAEEATARTALGYALAHLGDPDAGIAELQAARRLAEQAGDPTSELRAIGDHADVLLAAGRLEQAAEAALDGIRQARRLGQARQARAAGSVKDATVALMALGRWDHAEQVSREGLETIPSGAGSVGVPLARAALELALGDLDAAEARLRTALRVLPDPIPEPQLSGPLYCGLGRAVAVAGRPRPGQGAGGRGRAAGRGKPPPRRSPVRRRPARGGRPCRAGQGPLPRRGAGRRRHLRGTARAAQGSRHRPGRRRHAGVGRLAHPGACRADPPGGTA